MSIPLQLGNRPILSVGTNPHPDVVHTGDAGVVARVSRATGNLLGGALTRFGNTEDLKLQSGLNVSSVFGTGIAQRYVNTASMKALDEETRKILRGGYYKQERLTTVLSSKTPITLESARDIAVQAKGSKEPETREALVGAIHSLRSDVSKEQVDQELTVLEKVGLPPVVQDQLKAFDKERQQGVVQLPKYDSLFQGIDPADGRNVLQLVVEQCRDISLVDFFIDNGARLGLRDHNGDTEIDHALKAQDYFLAAKLKLALNYQRLRDSGASEEDIRKQSGVAVYHFSEGEKSFEEASEELFGKLNTAPLSYTHACLVCRHKDGHMTSRMVHFPGDLAPESPAHSLNGDMQIHNICTKMSQDPTSSMLARRPLRDGVPVNDSGERSKKSVAAEKTIYSMMGAVSSGVLSAVIDNGPTSVGTATVFGMVNGGLCSPVSADPKQKSAETIGKLVGGAVGMFTGTPVAAAQVGGLVANTVHTFSKTTADNLGSEFEQHQSTMDWALRSGGTISILDRIGNTTELTAENLPLFYAAVTGLGMPAVMFWQKMEDKRFRYAAIALIVAVVSGGLWFGPAIMPPLWALRLTLMVQGTLIPLEWDISKLMSFVSTTAKPLLSMCSGSRRKRPMSTRQQPPLVTPQTRTDQTSESEGEESEPDEQRPPVIKRRRVKTPTPTISESSTDEGDDSGLDSGPGEEPMDMDAPGYGQARTLQRRRKPITPKSRKKTTRSRSGDSTRNISNNRLSTRRRIM
ncbi:hypothetical protein [Parendozoicomonas haliclonae]|uniref:Uncharacterized protein n=1 Tax=Parendozoicomonas haliclonae TaxID=1960125 RepID=A0A1X7AJW8_9GAMM|nr:hypothetical protein [Parendozoicomonas haliclonae]SMA46415.1 hypothetical protein EHSB41UT_02166 [Parendozoicomonas haliclonae]